LVDQQVTARRTGEVAVVLVGEVLGSHQLFDQGRLADSAATRQGQHRTGPGAKSAIYNCLVLNEADVPIDEAGAESRILKVTQLVKTPISQRGGYSKWPTRGQNRPGAKSAIYDCLG